MPDGRFSEGMLQSSVAGLLLQDASGRVCMEQGKRGTAGPRSHRRGRRGGRCRLLALPPLFDEGRLEEWLGHDCCIELDGLDYPQSGERRRKGFWVHFRGPG